MIPKVAARNGRLSRAAVGLASFMLEYAPNGIAEWIEGHRRRVGNGRNAADGMIAEFSFIPSVSKKVAAMLLSDLLLGASKTRPEWIPIGAEMVVVDRIVHGVLHRAGAIDEFGDQHAYGPRCYQDSGCVGALRRIAGSIDAREYAQQYPRFFPRLIQHGIWQHGAMNEAGLCNAVRIPKGRSCTATECPAFPSCPKIRTE